MTRSKKIISAALTAAALSSFVAASAEELDSYMPNIHGAFRGRWELDTESGDNRFQVRNARISFDGKVAPTVSYFIQADFCDAGKMKILDAYGAVRIAKGLSVQAGQFRMPFGVETFRAPANYIFANRTFMGKQVMNYRAVGAKVAYTLPCAPAWKLEFGAFNPNTISDHNVWNRTVAYAGKAAYHVGEWTFTGGYASIRPSDTRANLVDACVEWNDHAHWQVVGEYMWKNYCNSPVSDTHSWVGFVDWHKSIHVGDFNRWSVQARVDGMNQNLSWNSDGSEVVQASRNRITVGSTISSIGKAVHADVRLNYEHFINTSAEPNRLVAELVVRF
jgi:hypothetical protein